MQWKLQWFIDDCSVLWVTRCYVSALVLHSCMQGLTQDYQLLVFQEGEIRHIPVL